MAKCIKVEKKDAEPIRRKLADAGLLDNSYSPESDKKFVYFAVKKAPAGMKLVQRKLGKRAKKGKPLREEMEGKLSKREMDALVGSFDIVGDIAVLELPPSLSGKEKMIAQTVLRNHRNVKVVAKKIGGTGGEFRIRPVEVIAGEDRTHTICREAGCEFELDLNNVYFSSRLATERDRIAALVKKSERVIVAFAGVGPYAIRIAKKEKGAKVVGVELNRAAVEYFWRNIRRNGCENCIAMQGDVSSALPGDFLGWADRAVMPHPSDGARFLENVIPCLKKGGVLHYYSFGDAARPYAKAEREVKAASAKLGRKATVIFRRIARPYSKETVQVVIDARLD